MATENVVVGVETIAVPLPVAAYELIMPSYEKKKRSKRHRSLLPPPPESSTSYRFSSDEDEGDAKRRHRSRAEMESAALALVMISRGGVCDRGGPRRVQDLPPPPPLPLPLLETKIRSYECSTCGKTFPTPQALGGHSTSHCRKPAAAVVTAVSTSTGGGPLAAAGKKSHECLRCHKSFPTGQALGGHMRRHFAGVSDGGAAAAGSTAEKETGAMCLLSEKSKNNRGFDLNEPATPLVPEWSWNFEPGKEGQL